MTESYCERGGGGGTSRQPAEGGRTACEDGPRCTSKACKSQPKSQRPRVVQGRKSIPAGEREAPDSETVDCQILSSLRRRANLTHIVVELSQHDVGTEGPGGVEGPGEERAGSAADVSPALKASGKRTLPCSTRLRAPRRRGRVRCRRAPGRSLCAAIRRGKQGQPSTTHIGRKAGHTFSAARKRIVRRSRDVRNISRKSPWTGLIPADKLVRTFKSEGTEKDQGTRSALRDRHRGNWDRQIA